MGFFLLHAHHHDMSRRSVSNYWKCVEYICKKAILKITRSKRKEKENISEKYSIFSKDWVEKRLIGTISTVCYCSTFDSFVRFFFSCLWISMTFRALNDDYIYTCIVENRYNDLDDFRQMISHTQSRACFTFLK